MSQNSDLDKVIRIAAEQGWTHEKLRNSHHRFKHPNGKDMVVTSGTPGDYRGWKNFLGEMKRRGFQMHPESNGQKEHGPKPRARGDITVMITDFFRQHSDRIVYVSELQTLLRQRYPDVGENSAASTVNRLMESGRLNRYGDGRYMWIRGDANIKAVEEPISTSHTEPETVETPDQPQEANAFSLIPETPAEPALQALPKRPARQMRSKVNQFDRDLQVVTSMINTLAELEGVIKRHRAFAESMEKFKSIMDDE